MKSADLATLRALHGRKRWEHIWAYYKLPIIGILIVLYIFGYAAYRHFTKKEAVLYVSLVNISAGSDLTGQLTDGFAQYAYLTKKQQVMTVKSRRARSSSSDAARSTLCGWRPSV